MEAISVCSECGAVWYQDETCQDRFYQMLYWENENPEYGAKVHHLMVLCYYLQHPSLYSPEGLHEAFRLLTEFVERGVAPADVRRRNKIRVDSGNRAWKIKGTADARGSYTPPVEWTITAADVIAGGSNSYCASVHAWAQSIYATLRASENYPPA